MLINSAYPIFMNGLFNTHFQINSYMKILRLNLLSQLLIVIISLTSCEKLELIKPIGFETNIEADTIVFGIIGDYGKSGDAESAVANLVKSWNPDFIITAGDNNYEKGELSTIKQNIGNYYSDYIYNFDAPSAYQCNGKAFQDSINRFFPCPGNHDANNKDGLLPYLNYFTLPYFETYYKFIWGPVSFFSLNSVNGNITEQQDWLFNELAQSNTPFNIVYFHHSPYTTGQHVNNPNMQWDFHNHNVDVVITGHDHIYSRIEKKGEPDLHYIINGLGGKSLYECNMEALPSDIFKAFCYNKDYGAILGVASKDKFELKFISVSQPNHPIDSLVIQR